MTGGDAAETMPTGNGTYRGARGLDPHVIADIRKMFGFDKARARTLRADAARLPDPGFSAAASFRTSRCCS